MFYCEPCRVDNKWPQGMQMSHGLCEICGKTTGCYDVPSSALPLSPNHTEPPGPDWEEGEDK